MTPPNLSRDLFVILSIKALIVLAAALFVFGPRQRPRIDGDALDRQFLTNSGKLTGALVR